MRSQFIAYVIGDSAATAMRWRLALMPSGREFTIAELRAEVEEQLGRRLDPASFSRDATNSGLLLEIGRRYGVRGRPPMVYCRRHEV